MSQYSSICWRCRGNNDSGIGTNCLDCREDGTNAMIILFAALGAIAAIVIGAVEVFA